MIFRQHRPKDTDNPRGVSALRVANFVFAALFLPVLCFVILLAVVSSGWQELARRAAVLHLRYALGRDVGLKALNLTRDGHLRLTGFSIGPGDGETRPLFAARAIDVQFDLVRLGAFPRRPLSAIRRVSVDTPSLSVSRDRAGRWNYADLLKPSAKPSGDLFAGEVVIRNGEIRYQDAVGFWAGQPTKGTHLVNIQGRLLKGTSYLPFHGSFSTADGRLRAVAITGSLHPTERRFMAAARFTDIDLAFITKHLPVSLPITVNSGRVDGRCQLAATVDTRTGKPTWNLTLLTDLRNVHGALAWEKGVLPYHVSSGQLALTRNTVELLGVRGTVGGVPAEIEGTISAFATPVIAVQARVTGAPARDVAKLIPGMTAVPFTVSGAVDAWVQLTGQQDDIQATGHFSGPAIHGEVFGDVRDIRSDFHFRGTSLELSHLSARAFDGRFAGGAWFALDKDAKTAALFTGQVDAMDVARVTAQFVPAPAPSPHGRKTYSPHDLHGTLSGPVTLRISGNADASLTADATGRIGVDDLLSGDVQTALRVDADADGAEVQITRLTARTPEGDLRLRGTVNRDATLHFDLEGSTLNLAALSKRFNLPTMAGNGYFTGKLAGAAAAPRATGRLHAQTGHVNGMVFSDITADVEASLGDTPTVTLANIRMVAGESQLLAAARIAADFTQVKPIWEMSGNANLPNMTIHSLGKALGVDLPIEGFIEGSMTLSGLPTDARGQGSLIIRHPILRLGEASLELDRVTAENIKLNGKTLQITNAQVVYPGVPTPITISGRISLDPKTPPEQQLFLNVKAPALDLDKFSTLSNGADSTPFHLTKDARLWLPFDAAGTFALNATVTGQLTPALGSTAAETLANTLTIMATADAGESLVIAGIPYARCVAGVEYQGSDQTLTLSRFELARTDDHGSYEISSTEPGSISLPIHDTDVQLDLHLAFQSDHLNQIKRDVLAMSANTDAHPLLTPLMTAVQSVPSPYDGTAKAQINLRGTPQQPLIESEFTLTSLTVAGNPVADIEGAIAYDAFPRMLTIERLTTSGGPAPEATASLEGTITLPVKDARGREITPGPMNLHLVAQDLNPAVFAPWLKDMPLSEIEGAATVIVDIDSTTSNPRVRASIDMFNPSFHGVEFGLLAAIVTLEDNRLILGRKVKREDGEITRVPTILAFKDNGGEGSKPLQLYGEIPVRWKGPLAPELASGEDVFFTVELPKQGLDLARAYIPGFPEGEGSVESALEVHGTLGAKRFEVVNTSGRFIAQAPELRLNTTDSDMPDRLRDVVVDIGLHSDGAATQRNLIAVNNVSLTYDRAGKPTKRDSRLLRWVKSQLGIEITEPFAPGTFTVRGTIDPQPLLTSQETIPLEQMFNRLGYDLYAEMRDLTLVQKHDLFKGKVAAFLHLGNHGNPDEGAARPLLSGVLYAENAKVSLSAKEQQGQARHTGAVAGMPRFPFNPDLSLAVQMGKGNILEARPGNTFFDNVLSSILSADVAFAPTSARVRDGEALARWPIEPYHYTAETLQSNDYTGTRAWVTGSLLQPIIGGEYVLQPRKSELFLPGGTLNVAEGKGEVNIRPTDPQPVKRLTMEGKATGTVDEYRIAAYIKGDLANMQGEGSPTFGSGDSEDILNQLPVRFETVSAPRGAPMLSHTEISKRLTGVPDFLAALTSTDAQAWSPIIQHVGSNLFLNDMMKVWAEKLGLESFTVNATPELYPEASITLQEFGKSNWGSFRLGASRTFADPVEWDMWLDYRLPDYKKLRNLSINTTVNSEDETGVNLQYRLEF